MNVITYLNFKEGIIIMAKKTLTVYEALQERKLIKAKLERARFTKKYITSARECDEQIDGVSIDEIKRSLKGNFDSVNQLFKNFAAYTAAINQSNAVTKVTIAGKEYTVAEAISRYQTLGAEREFLQELTNQYNLVKNDVTNHNEKVLDPDKISEYIRNVLGDSKKDQSLIDSTIDTYKKKNLKVLIDPNNLEEEIQKRLEELNNFIEQFHFVLTRSNATTEITVELED